MAGSQLGLVTAVWRRQHELRLSQVAAGVAFWLLIAVFPAGLVVVNVAGLVMAQESVARFLGRFVSATPGSLGDLVAQQLQVVAAPSPGSILTDIALVAVALWTVSTAMHHLVRGLQVAYGLEATRVLPTRIGAVALAAGGIVALGLLAWALDLATLVGSLLGYLASAAVLTLLVTVVFRVVSGRQPFRSHLPGALVATGGFVLIAVGLEVYSAVAPNLRLIYGTVAGVLISMLGLWLGVYAVLVGAACNGELQGR